MKKIILFTVASLFFSAAGYAQGAYKYCDLQVYQPVFKNYFAELHTDSTRSAAKTLVRDKDGNKMKFASEADALNYVARQGWELVSSWQHQNIVHFIMKKPG